MVHYSEGHHHHHHLFRPAVQNSTYKYQLTASRTVRLSLSANNCPYHSLIQMSEMRHTFHMHNAKNKHTRNKNK